MYARRQRPDERPPPLLMRRASMSRAHIPPEFQSAPQLDARDAKNAPFQSSARDRRAITYSQSPPPTRPYRMMDKSPRFPKFEKSDEDPREPPRPASQIQVRGGR